ncbi:MAG: sialidase family protein, partial [Planctomycetaceae bacterium]
MQAETTRGWEAGTLRIAPWTSTKLVGYVVTATLLGIVVGLPAKVTWSADDLQRVDVFQSGRGGYHTYRIPALVVAPDRSLLAFCEGRKSSRADHGDVDLVLRRSRDGGRSWSAIQVVFEIGGTQNITIGNPCP